MTPDGRAAGLHLEARDGWYRWAHHDDRGVAVRAGRWTRNGARAVRGLTDPGHRTVTVATRDDEAERGPGPTPRLQLVG